MFMEERPLDVSSKFEHSNINNVTDGGLDHHFDEQQLDESVQSILRSERVTAPLHDVLDRHETSALQRNKLAEGIRELVERNEMSKQDTLHEATIFFASESIGIEIPLVLEDPGHDRKERVTAPCTLPPSPLRVTSASNSPRHAPMPELQVPQREMEISEEPQESYISSQLAGWLAASQVGVLIGCGQSVVEPSLPMPPRPKALPPSPQAVRSVPVTLPPSPLKSAPSDSLTDCQMTPPPRRNECVTQPNPPTPPQKIGTVRRDVAVPVASSRLSPLPSPPVATISRQSG